MNRKLKLIIFDLDGTLVNAFKAVSQSLNHALPYHGYEKIDEKIIERNVGWGERSLISRFVKPQDLNKVHKSYKKHHQTALPKGVKFLPTAKTVLNRLKKEKYTLAVASNRPSRFSRIILKALEIKPVFKAVLCADQVKKGKPAPYLLTEIMAKLGAKPSQSVYVGDMPIDAQAAKRARMKSIIVTTGSYSKAEVAESQPFAILDKMSELPPILDKINSI